MVSQLSSDRLEKLNRSDTRFWKSQKLLSYALTSVLVPLDKNDTTTDNNVIMCSGYYYLLFFSFVLEFPITGTSLSQSVDALW